MGVANDSSPQRRSLGRDRPCFILINAGSGNQAASAVEQAMRAVLTELGQNHEFVHMGEAERLPELARHHAAQARALDGALVVAGGDGTISGTLEAALAEQCLFAVVPVGTFNYFARAHGISEDPAEATRTFLNGTATPVRIGLVGGRPFAVNASIGLHPQALEERERAQAKLGRSRLISIGAALVTLLRGHRQLPLELDHDGIVERRHSSTLVVANNELQLEQVGVDEGVGADPRRLTAITVAARGIWSALGLFLRTALGRLGEADNATTFSFERMTVSPARSSLRRRIKVAVDGEIHWHDMPLVFEVAPRKLQLLRSMDGPREAEL